MVTQIPCLIFAHFLYKLIEGIFDKISMYCLFGDHFMSIFDRHNCYHYFDGALILNYRNLGLTFLSLTVLLMVQIAKKQLYGSLTRRKIKLCLSFVVQMLSKLVDQQGIFIMF